jgi:hypothetical protein
MGGRLAARLASQDGGEVILLGAPVVKQAFIPAEAAFEATGHPKVHFHLARTGDRLSPLWNGMKI